MEKEPPKKQLTKGARRKWELIKDEKPVSLQASMVIGKIVEISNTKSTKLVP